MYLSASMAEANRYCFSNDKYVRQSNPDAASSAEKSSREGSRTGTDRLRSWRRENISEKEPCRNPENTSAPPAASTRNNSPMPLDGSSSQCNTEATTAPPNTP